MKSTLIATKYYFVYLYKHLPNKKKSNLFTTQKENVLPFISSCITIYYSTFIHCTNSDFLIGWFVPRDPGLWRNNLLDVIIVV